MPIALPKVQTTTIDLSEFGMNGTITVRGLSGILTAKLQSIMHKIMRADGIDSTKLTEAEAEEYENVYAMDIMMTTLQICMVDYPGKENDGDSLARSDLEFLPDEFIIRLFEEIGKLSEFPLEEKPGKARSTKKGPKDISAKS